MERLAPSTTFWLKTMKKGFALLAFFLALSSCKTWFPTAEESAVFKTWDKLEYPYQEIVNANTSKSLQDILKNEEISMLESWRKSVPILENLLQSECAGCSNKTADLKPVYKKAKGKFIHFGLKDDMGVENWVFKKSGAFVTRFYMFQGESKKKINEELKDIRNIDYVVEGIYPDEINTKNVYLEHVSYAHNVDVDNQWYETMYPTKIGYAIDLKQKNSVIRFKFDGGLFSYQKPGDQGLFQIINFVEPLVYANAVAINEPMSYSSFTDAFYANATFFLLDLDEDAQVSIRIETKVAGKDFKFSVFDNDGFYTMEEYLQKESPLFNRYQNKMGKGEFLIRVLHENSDYAEKPLYTIYIDKSNVD